MSTATAASPTLTALVADLLDGRIRVVDLTQTLANKTKPTEIAQALLLRAPAPETLRAIESKSETNPAQIAGLVLGSPEFQRR